MTPLVSEGLNLAIYGMGTVFIFLTLLVLATVAMSRLVGMTSSTGATSSPQTSGSSNEKKKLAAISAALHAHRQAKS